MKGITLAGGVMKPSFISPSVRWSIRKNNNNNQKKSVRMFACTQLSNLMIHEDDLFQTVPTGGHCGGTKPRDFIPHAVHHVCTVTWNVLSVTCSCIDLFLTSKEKWKSFYSVENPAQISLKCLHWLGQWWKTESAFSFKFSKMKQKYVVHRAKERLFTAHFLPFCFFKKHWIVCNYTELK